MEEEGKHKAKMVSISSNVFFGACALIFLGLHFGIYQTDAKKLFVVDEGNSILENELTDHIIKHPKRHKYFS